MRKLATLMCFTLLLGCASTVNVLSEYDESADFDNYSTFVICLDDLFVENIEYPNYDNNYVRELIGEEIMKQMIAKGHETNVLEPELQAGFQLVVEEKEATFTNCELDDEYNYWHECTINTTIYTEETLVIYVSNFEKNQIIWQASMQCDMSKSKAILPKYIKEIVDKIFKEYPKVI